MFDFDAMLRLSDQLHTILCLARDNEAARPALLDSATAVLDSLSVSLTSKNASVIDDEE